MNTTLRTRSTAFALAALLTMSILAGIDALATAEPARSAWAQAASAPPAANSAATAAATAAATEAAATRRPRS